MQLLVEKSYDQVTIRDVVTLAGVGIGSFYEYFASKQALAAVCVHLRFKELLASMRNNLAAARQQPLPARVDALLGAHAGLPMEEPEQWAALLRLERQVSEIGAYRRLYAQYVALWSEALSAGPDWPAGSDIEQSAFIAHTISHGIVSQSLLNSVKRPEAAAVRRQIRTAVHGYLSVVAPPAYRLFRFET